MNKTYYIGLDAHAQNTVIAYASSTGAPEHYGKCVSSNLNVERALKRLAKKIGTDREHMKICYEAGPTGFVLVRHLRSLGYDCCVIAPSLIPQRPGERVKTDKRDAGKLARLLRSGELEPIHIPEPDDEAMRDLYRARDGAADDLRRIRQRFGAFLLRNGYRYTGKSRWSVGHMTYLRDLKLPSEEQDIVREEYIQAMDFAIQRIQRFEERIREKMKTWKRRFAAEATMAMRSFALVGGVGIVSEIGDFTRFTHPRQLSAYLGLVPSEMSSGTTRRQGAITKCGNSRVRRLLVEAAHNYRRPPKVSRDLSARQGDLPAAVKDLSWRAQTRLHRRWAYLLKRGLHPNKIAVAIARELATFVWELHVKVLSKQTPSVDSINSIYYVVKTT